MGLCRVGPCSSSSSDKVVKLVVKGFVMNGAVKRDPGSNKSSTLQCSEMEWNCPALHLQHLQSCSAVGLFVLPVCAIKLAGPPSITALWCTLLRCTALKYYTTLHCNTTPHCTTILHQTTLHFIVNTAMKCTQLYKIAVHCSPLHCTWLCTSPVSEVAAAVPAAVIALTTLCYLFTTLTFQLHGFVHVLV